VLNIFKNLSFILLVVGLLLPATAFSQNKSTPVKGTITVDPEIDDSGDYSGISLNILNLGGEFGIDTLFTATTNRAGQFSGTARFKSKGEYTASVSRYGNPITAFAIILAERDPVTITGMLPGLEGTLKIESKEHQAMETYQRVERNYNRIVDFINSGVVEVTQDTIPVILNTWSDLFWSLKESYPNTLAADIGSLRAVEIIAGYNDEKVIERVKASISEKSFYVSAKARVGAGALIRTESVDAALAFIERLLQRNLNEEDRLSLEMERIEIKIDHGRENEAKQLLQAFRQKYAGNESLTDWVDVMVYDIENLFPGLPVPSFSMQLHRGGRIQSSELEEKVYLIEIVNFANQAYHTEFTILNLLYEEFKEKGFEIITIPTHDRRVTVQAFIEDRNVAWPVVSAGQFTSADVIQKFNLTVIPTRILVDAQGKIIRKYSGTNFAIIQNDLIKLFEEESL